MFMEVTLKNKRRQSQGRVQLELDFGKREWRVQETFEGNGWTQIGFSNPARGKINIVKHALQLVDHRNTTAVIVWDPPKHEDSDATSGEGAIYKPKSSSLEDGKIAWKSSGLTPLRKEVLRRIRKNFPAYPGRLPIPNQFDRSKSYGGGVTNCGVLPSWIALQLGYYLPGQQVANPRLKVPSSDIIESDYGKLVYTAPMAPGWGRAGNFESYPRLLERSRGVAEGTIWVHFNGGRSNKNLRPLPGDIYVLMKNYAGEFAHVGIVIDSVGKVWRTADCGQYGQNAAAYKKRIFDPKAGTLILDPPETNPQDGGTRYLQGWINIDNMFANWTP